MVHPTGGARTTHTKVINGEVKHHLPAGIYAAMGSLKMNVREHWLPDS